MIKLTHLLALKSKGSAYGTSTAFRIVIFNWGEFEGLEVIVLDLEKKIYYLMRARAGVKGSGFKGVYFLNVWC